MSLETNVSGLRGDGSAILGNDASMFARFYKGKRLSKFKSEQAGEPIYIDIDMIEVIQPGEKETVAVEAEQHHKNRFPKQWDAYQQGVELASTGTPLAILFPLEKETVSLLNSMHIYTIQQLANLNDTAITNVPFGRTLKERAAKHIQTHEGGTEFEKLAKQNAALLARLEKLEQAPREKRKYTKRVKEENKDVVSN